MIVRRASHQVFQNGRKYCENVKLVMNSNFAFAFVPPEGSMSTWTYGSHSRFTHSEYDLDDMLTSETISTSLGDYINNSSFACNTNTTYDNCMSDALHTYTDLIPSYVHKMKHGEKLVSSLQPTKVELFALCVGWRGGGGCWTPSSFLFDWPKTFPDCRVIFSQKDTIEKLHL